MSSKIRKKYEVFQIDDYSDTDRKRIFSHIQKGDGLAALRKWMRLYGVTSLEMSERLGISKWLFSRYLGGTKNLPIHHQIVIQHMTGGLIRLEDFINPRISAFLDHNKRREGVERVLNFDDGDLL